MTVHSQVFAAFCLRNLWCDDVWVRPDLPVSGVTLTGKFLETLAAVQLNDSVELVAFSETKPKTSQACWFITRKCRSSDQMWAGKVLGMYRYRSPLVADTFDVLLEVEWHAPMVGQRGDGGVAIDPYMNVPLVNPKAASVANTGSRYYLAVDVAPCRVHVMPSPKRGGPLCVLSKSFSFMRVAGWEPLRPQTPWARSTH